MGRQKPQCTQSPISAASGGWTASKALPGGGALAGMPRATVAALALGATGTPSTGGGVCAVAGRSAAPSAEFPLGSGPLGVSAVI